MKQFKIFIDFEKEAQYLRCMAKKGYHLKKYDMLGFFHFEKAEPASLNYRVDYRMFWTRSKYLAYLTMFEDGGWEHVAGSTCTGTQMFLPKQGAPQTEDIYSDAESMAGRYKRNLALLIPGIFICLLNVILYSQSMITEQNWSYSDPKSWYFTPGLWEGGYDLFFWRAFLFETPFVFMRTIFPPLWVLLTTIFTVVCGVCTAKTYSLYRKTYAKEITNQSG